MKLRKVATALLAASFTGIMPLAHGQLFPTKPVRLVISFPPGAGPDVLARALTPKLAEKWGHPVVAENRPGGGGNLATELVARSAPDGHTLIVLSNHFTINPSLFKKVPYDPVKEFTPIVLATGTPTALVVHPSVPVSNVKGLLALAQSRPGQLDFSSGGNGSVSHMAGVMLQGATGIKLVHVPYRGPAEASVAVVGGHVVFTFITMPSALTHSRAGRLKAVAVSSAKRSVAAPDWPTVAESGVPGFDLIAWQGLLAPTGMPASVINTLNRDILAALGTTEVKTTLANLGLEVLGGTPTDFAQFISRDLVTWADVVRKTGAKVD
jgi:tripartite-type tricarboxylate transporter receptor subunit TctC